MARGDYSSRWNQGLSSADVASGDNPRFFRWAQYKHRDLYNWEREEERNQGKCDHGRMAQRSNVAALKLKEGARSQGMPAASEVGKGQEMYTPLESP